LGYTYLGNWKDRPNNSNIEEALLTSYLSKKGYNPTLIKGNRGVTSSFFTSVKNEEPSVRQRFI